eukprot:scaffold81389_cov30-Tisochrysis_lutea.AAC.8
MLIELRVGAPGESPSASFLHESPASSCVAEVLHQVLAVYNIRARIARALSRRTAAEQPEQEVSQSSCDHTAALAQAAEILSPESIARKVVVSREQLEAILALLGDDASTPDGAATAEDAQLLFAGQPLEADMRLSTKFGVNEKSKVVLALSVKPSASAQSNTSGVTGAAIAACSSDAVSSTTSLAVAMLDSTLDEGGSEASAVPGDKRSLPAEGEPQPHQQAASNEMSLSSFFKRARATGDVDGVVQEKESVFADPTADAEEDESLLTEAQVAAVHSSEAVKSALHSHQLRRILRQIDGADTRESALRRLEAALEEPDFNAFTRTVLREIGHDTAAELEE